MVGFIKPESALRRADELIDVGKKQRALETLFEVITARRHRTWTKIHEPLMEKFLNLCVDLRKSQLAKDGLHQYKTISQSVSVKSLEDVVIGYLKQGEERCVNARAEATNVLVDIDDLEVIQTPESLLLSAVSGESQQDRTDRDLLAPWLKFVWESYKQCLDLLKNNNRVEKIYQEVARMAFRFCKQYNRRPEFRKLCDIIRTHFTQSQKYSQQTYSVNIHLPETQVLYLETRLIQLNTAIDMDLWQEAFKAVEDIHTVTTISKKPPRPQELSSYYEKIALVFWKAGNYVFHATAVLKFYVLHKEQKKNITQAELSRLSTKTLLSILSIPLPISRTKIDEHLETDETMNEKQKRLTNLLSLQQIPTRASLIRDMIKQGVLNFVYPELRNMYEQLEVEFNPLKLSTQMEESIQFVEQLNQSDYSQYIPALRDVTVIRLLQQISQVYQTIELKRFIELAPAMDKHRLEKLIVNAGRNRDVQVRIEHKSKALIFGMDMNPFHGQAITNDGISKSNIIQKMPNEQIRNQLISISRALYTSMEIINEKSSKEGNEKLRRQIAETYVRDIAIQRKDILKRRDVIERYKEEKEKKSNDEIKRKEIVSRHEQDERAKEEKTRRDDDLKRQRAEAALEREQDEHRLNMKIAIERLRESEIGRHIIELISEEELYKYDPESLNALHIRAVIDFSREQKKKLKVQFKKVDFLIRAQHEMEIPLIEKYSEEEVRRRREIQFTERERTMERSERLLRMEGDKQDFLQSIRGQRHEDFILQMKEFELRMQKARQQRLEQLRKEHIEKKKEQFRKEKQRKQQEKLNQEEKLRLANLRAENTVKNKELDRQAEIQRARERDIEEKMQGIKSVPVTKEIPIQKEKDRTDGPSWRRNVHDTDSKENWRDQRPKMNDRRLDEPTSNKGASNESWRSKTRPERDDKRTVASPPPPADRWSERNLDKSDSWRTVEKKRLNPSRNENDRPFQQRTGESSSSSSGVWRPKPRVPEETRDNIRASPNLNSTGNRGRADENSNWRTREKTRLKSWRADDSDDENERPSSNTRLTGGKQE